jgi:large subunit ribosomal protein L6
MKKINSLKLFRLNFPRETRILFFRTHFIINGPCGTVAFSQFLNRNKYIINLSKDSLRISKKKYIEKTKLLKLYNLFQNMIFGVNFLFSKKLSLVGVGFRVWLKNKKSTKVLLVKVGFSEDLYIPIPKNIIIYSLRPTLLLIRGLQKNKVNQFCSFIRCYKTPDKYKGKGFQFKKEIILLKPGKQN